MTNFSQFKEGVQNRGCYPIKSFLLSNFDVVFMIPYLRKLIKECNNHFIPNIEQVRKPYVLLKLKLLYIEDIGDFQSHYIF